MTTKPCGKNHRAGVYCARCQKVKITRLREFLELVRDCPPSELHLMPLAADALLTELGE